MLYYIMHAAKHSISEKLT